MSSIDWHYLRRPLILFAVALLISVALVLAGLQYESAKRKDYEQAVSALSTTFRLYRNIINDIDLLEQYRNLYGEYKASGLVGEERRLSWIESLESTNEVLRLPTLTYNLHPQEKFERPKFRQKPGVAVQSSPMELSIGMLHEEDLFALLEGLRLSIKSLFTVDSCSMIRLSSVEQSLDTKRPNLNTKCIIRWVTINAK